MTNFLVLDCETDNLAYDCTKIHILSWTEDDSICEVCSGEGFIMGGPNTYGNSCNSCSGTGKLVQHTNSYDEMRKLLSQEDTLFVCHNSVRFDMVVFHRILGIPMDYRKWVDTLGLSWFLWPDRKSHSLESFTEEVGIKKPKVDDWENVTWDQMKERCGSDVLINWRVWGMQRKRLEEIYG